MNRRRFLATLCATAGLGLAAPALAATAGRTRWRMALAWTSDMELFKAGAFRFARQVSLLTESRLAVDVNVASPSMPPLSVLDRVASGEVECAHVFTSYWADRHPALHWFTGIPFGLDAAGTNVWLYKGGGAQALRKACLDLGVYAMPMGDTGGSGFGWMRRVPETPDELRGLCLPAWGLAGSVLARAGATVTEHPQISGPDIAAELAAGRIDGAWWHGPHHECLLGMDRHASAYCSPGWQNRAGRMVLIINRKAYDAVPPVIRRIVDACAMQEDMRLQCDFRTANAQAMAACVAARPDVRRTLSNPIVEHLREIARDVIAEVSGSDAELRRLAEEYHSVQERLGGLREVAMAAPGGA
ncbi:TRAP-type mannitol/chloroaromatic compound transport system substrate-binding protein [Desulfobaculum xiamenense]|uniref:TRAP-type mannitol/chloroaromatic compound transport system substrate-binding protein n=1 Tax=Desulfobaculum xiamenense TaxID=995050 RepID=A0A846QRA7_9BACT|nr:hypothetical protein [Desulfobaculum xiamenense]NJB69032.1 TRAP-type mannitol/chloroaromatic compound transport system substrate-binding protein [Desulfobaculum xiamenense]